MEHRILSRDEISKICFSHLNYSNGDDDMSWMISFLIALPLVLISVYLSKCLIFKPVQDTLNYLPSAKEEDIKSESTEPEEPDDVQSYHTSDDEVDIEKLALQNK